VVEQAALLLRHVESLAWGMACVGKNPAGVGENRGVSRSAPMNHIARLFLSLCAALLAGCAALSDVTPIGPDSFMATSHSNDVNARVDEQRAKVAQSAAEFCAKRGAVVDVIRSVASAPPPGRPPSAELDFRCKPG
jgi:hypothetical protein